MKEEGSIYVDFIKRFLEPLFLASVDIFKSKIVKYDKAVMTALGKRPGNGCILKINCDNYQLK